MSHLGKYKTTISNAHKGISKKALELLSEELETKLVDLTNKKYYSRLNNENCNVGVIEVKLNYNKSQRSYTTQLGVNVDSRGNLEFLHDNMKNSALEEHKERFISLYQAVAVNMALRRMKFKTQVVRKADSKEVAIIGEK